MSLISDIQSAKSVGLYDVDSKIPNLALMKLSGYTKQLGKTVGWAAPLETTMFDLTAASAIFEYSDKGQLHFYDYTGGTGLDMSVKMPDEVDTATTDYDLYGVDYSVAFLARGCRLNCSFCVVPRKEGKMNPRQGMRAAHDNPKSNKVLLLDNDFFGNRYWSDNCDEAVDMKLKVSIMQGINLRAITEEQAVALKRLNPWCQKFKSRRVYTAWDNIRHERAFMRGAMRMKQAGYNMANMLVYVLIGYDSTPEQDLYRVEALRYIGAQPYAMPYNKNDRYQKDFCRWVNHKAVFRTCTWAEYKAGGPK